MAKLELHRWRRAADEGDAIVLIPRDGPPGMTIRIREHVRPLTTLHGAPAACLAAASVGDGETWSTREGELAGVLERESGIRALIWGDTEQVEIEGTGADDRARAHVGKVVREIAYYLSLGLHPIRSRQYRYWPIEGWQVTAHGLASEWTSPDGVASIRVLPARPVTRDVSSEIAQYLQEDPFVDLVVKSPIERSKVEVNGLTGVRGRAAGHARGEPRTFVTVALEDEQFVYASRLTTREHSARYEPVFDRFVASIVGRPRPQPREIASVYVVD